MDGPVAVGVDDSPSSMRALDWAADEAALHNLPLRIVHASVWERFEGTTPAEDLRENRAEAAALEEIITDAEARARQRRPEVKVHGSAARGTHRRPGPRGRRRLRAGRRPSRAPCPRAPPVHRFRRARCRRTRVVPHRGRWRLRSRTPIRTPADRRRCRGRNRHRRRPCRLRPPRGTGPRWRPGRGSRPQPAGNAGTCGRLGPALFVSGAIHAESEAVITPDAPRPLRSPIFAGGDVDRRG